MPWTATHNDPDIREATTAHAAHVDSQDAGPRALPAILLVEPDAKRATSRSLFLQAADYAVIPVKSSRELQSLSEAEPIAVVMVSEGFERSGLKQVAQASRAKWPSARILVLGQAQRVLDDHLYDDAIEEPFKPKDLLDTLVRLITEFWSEHLRSTPGAERRPALSQSATLHLVAPAESDPTKSFAPASASSAPAWDMPAGERLDLSTSSLMQTQHELLSAERNVDEPDRGARR